MKVYRGKPFVRLATAGVFADVGRFAGVQTSVNEHVGAFGEGLVALWTGVQLSVFANGSRKLGRLRVHDWLAGWGVAGRGVARRGER